MKIMGFLLGVTAILAVLSISSYSKIEIPYISRDEIASPYDRIKESQIQVLDDRVVLNIKDASWTAYADTNSMDPLLDNGANGIEIIPQGIDDIHVGDVVAYESEYGLIVHRVVDVKKDDDGMYFVMKGDNNTQPDSWKVRYEDIKFILVGVIY